MKRIPAEFQRPKKQVLGTHEIPTEKTRTLQLWGPGPCSGWFSAPRPHGVLEGLRFDALVAIHKDPPGATSQRREGGPLQRLAVLSSTKLRFKYKTVQGLQVGDPLLCCWKGNLIGK